MKFRIIFLYAIIFILDSAYCFGQRSYYFSSVNGNDLNSGTSAGAPCKSLTKLQQLLPSLVAGDVIYFERGSIWHETDIKINTRNGSATNPIIFKAYGTGAKPILSGSKVLSDFTRSGNIHSVSVYKDFASAPMNVPTGILINGSWKDIARSEESLVYGSNSASQITDPAANWTTNKYTGALILLQPVHWHWTPSPIISNTSNTLTFRAVQHSASSAKLTAYYIANHDDFLQSNGDWTFKNRTLKVFFNSDLNQQNVQFAVSDSIISLSNCSYIEFNDIVFEMVNFKHISVYGGANIKISGCEFRYTAGESIKFFDTDDIFFFNNYVHDCGAVGLRLTYFGYAEVKHNLFRRIAAQNIGMANYDFRMGAAITVNYSTSPTFYIQYNYFDSVALAVQSHTFRSDGSANISYNYVENFGITLSDCGAFYFNSDMGTNALRYIKNNFVRNSITAGNRYPDNFHPVLHPHAFYIDDGALAYYCDSNTIENVSYALFMSRSYKNSFKHSNIVNANKDNPAFYNAVFMKDQSVGIINQSADRDTIMYNNIVLDNVNPRVYLRHTFEAAVNSGLDNNLFYFDYNKIANPFYDGETYIGRYVYAWGLADYNYTLTQMRADGGMVSSIPTDAHSTVNPQTIKYSDVSSLIGKNDFVRLYTNYSAHPRVVNLGNVSFRDINGTVITGSTTIPPFYSKILFFQSGTISTAAVESYIDSSLVPALTWDENGYVNHAPVINNTTFTVHESNPQPLTIGTIQHSDVDDIQGHTFSIISGNSNGLFAINNSGTLSFSSSSISFINNPVYQLMMRITDNGSPALSCDALVTINLIASTANTAPLMENQEFEYHATEATSLLVGRVIAYDPDGNQLSYDITGGNENYFTIDMVTGDISIKESDLGLSVPTSFTLNIRVTDNGSPQLYDDAVITILYTPAGYILYIDPSASVNGNGTLASPINSLAGLSFTTNYNYLIKRNTISSLDGILINADNIRIGSYGEGDLPVIESSSTEHIIRAVDRRNITISDLKIIAYNALSAIYFLGPGSDEILISNCIIEGTDYGLRFINTGNSITEYCQFINNLNGAYVIGKTSNFHYNVFSGNSYGLNISAPASAADILNNVFYDNHVAVAFSGFQLNIYNNILYLKENGDKAITAIVNNIQSDYNIFYPEQEGFFSVSNLTYNTLDDLNQFELLDLNSMVNNPCFIDPGDYNFHLAYNSPAIDAGKYVGLQYDINGVPIPVGNAPDIGINEYMSGPNSLDRVLPMSSSTGIQVYPNPVINELVVSLNRHLAGDETIQIYDLLGHLFMQSKAREVGIYEGNYVIDVSSLMSGIYILRVIHEDEISAVKFLKK